MKGILAVPGGQLTSKPTWFSPLWVPKYVGFFGPSSVWRMDHPEHDANKVVADGIGVLAKPLRSKATEAKAGFASTSRPAGGGFVSPWVGGPPAPSDDLNDDNRHEECQGEPEMGRSPLGVVLLPLFLTAGCGWTWGQESSRALNANDTTPAMKRQGIVYILPGIQGVDDHYKTIRQGLRRSGLNCAIMIHPWGSQIPGVKLAVNQLDTDAGRDWGKKIAENISAYQRRYPGRAVHILGQSGGSAVAVFALEALAESGAAPVAGVILLDASLSADYDLTRALGKSTKGIVNFCNIEDVAVLGVGTAVMGNVDGGHGDSAGRTGFKAKYPILHQVKVTPEMVSVSDASHFADTSAAFAARYIAPWIISHRWPVAGVLPDNSVGLQGRPLPDGQAPKRVAPYTVPAGALASEALVRLIAITLLLAGHSEENT